MKSFEFLPTLIGLMADDATGAAGPAGLISKVRQRLEDILHHSSAYHFGPADRLVGPPREAEKLLVVREGQRPDQRQRVHGGLVHECRAALHVELVATAQGAPLDLDLHSIAEKFITKEAAAHASRCFPALPSICGDSAR